jgi:hypothetical protein
VKGRNGAPRLTRPRRAGQRLLTSFGQEAVPPISLSPESSMALPSLAARESRRTASFASCGRDEEGFSSCSVRLCHRAVLAVVRFLGARGMKVPVIRGEDVRPVTGTDGVTRMIGSGRRVVQWEEATRDRITRVLKNPTYAGAVVNGRRGQVLDRATGRKRSGVARKRGNARGAKGPCCSALPPTTREAGAA